MNKKSAGIQSASNRSDCYVELQSKKSGGIRLELNSKVESMYGDNLRSMVYEMCNSFGLKHLNIFIDDYGALPFAFAARFETAVKRLYPEIESDYLLPMNKKNRYGATKDHPRRSRLYLPGNQPKMFVNAGLHKPDGIILDLEDSVAHDQKDAARFLVRNALRSVNFYGAERMVRINQLPAGLDDLDYIIRHNVHVILIPKCETAEDVIKTDEKVSLLKKKFGIRKDIFFMPIIESALGIVNAFAIASASENNCALAIGLEDYTADLGVARTKEGTESFFARSIIVTAAKAAGIQAIDTVFSDVSDMEGLYNSVLEAKSLGFEGKGCIHPRQIKVVHDGFAPTDDEVEKAGKIVSAYEDAKKKGLGVVSIGSKMIDAPVVKRALHTLKIANI